MRLVREEDHFSPNRGEAAVWGKVVRRLSESNARDRRLSRTSQTAGPGRSASSGSPKGNVMLAWSRNHGVKVAFERIFPGLCVFFLHALLPPEENNSILLWWEEKP